jgi:hypothetical protein
MDEHHEDPYGLPPRLDVPSPYSGIVSYQIPEVAIGTTPDGASGVLLVRYRESTSSHFAAPNGNTLNEFVRLADLPESEFPGAVRDFAEVWGPLELCSHRFPGRGARRCPPWLEPDGDWETSEPLGAWRYYALQLQLLFRAGLALQRGVELPAEWLKDVKAMLPPPYFPPDPSERPCISMWPRGRQRDDQPPIAAHKLAVADAAWAWCKFGDTGLLPFWAPSSPTLDINLGYPGLAAALAFDLLAGLRSGVFTCAGCSSPFVPKAGRRRPAEKRKAWCSLCGHEAQQRIYQRQHYADPAVRERRRQRYLRSKAAKPRADSQTDSQPSGDNASNGA